MWIEEKNQLLDSAVNFPLSKEILISARRAVHAECPEVDNRSLALIGLPPTSCSLYVQYAAPPHDRMTTSPQSHNVKH